MNKDLVQEPIPNKQAIKYNLPKLYHNVSCLSFF